MKVIDKNKQKIIIKVKRRNIKEKLLQALDEIEFSLKIFSQIPYFKVMNVYEIFEENKLMMLHQLDFEKEVNNIEHMHSLNANISYLKIPQVYKEFTEPKS